ncbi:MAG TPA: GNAT family N-acetyltransferase [Actinomycetota bacterium]|nr:GNAT family N-acetyltransferase [Actinomycetota bacterium]
MSIGGDAPTESVEIQIREGAETDIEAAARVLRAAYDEYRGPLEERFEIYIADVVDVVSRWGSSELLVATIGGELVGCVNYYSDASRAEYPGDATPFPSDWVAIRLLAVDPVRRGHGVGRALTDACIDRAREEGAPVLGLHTTDAMRVARSMYERMRFERLPAYDFHPTPTIAVLAYKLDL